MAIPDPCSCITRSRIGLDPMAPVAWDFVIVLSVRYVSLITCGSAEDDAMGARLTLRRLRGVIRIMWEVIDKAGLNRLLVPHQSLFLSPIQLSLLLSTTMPRTVNTYTVLFEPVRNGPGEFATAKEKFNLQQFVKKWGSRTTPYPSFVDVYQSLNVVWRMPTRSKIFNWRTLLRPTKGGCHVGYPFGVV
jgi:hypothetical protein